MFRAGFFYFEILALQGEKKMSKSKTLVGIFEGLSKR
jgi:hypothetical protein